MELLENKAQFFVAQVGEFVVVEMFDRRAIELVAATGGPIQAADDVHGRALSGAGCTHHRDIVTAVHLEGEAVEGSDLRIACAVDLADVDQFGNGLVGSR